MAIIEINQACNTSVDEQIIKKAASTTLDVEKRLNQSASDLELSIYLTDDMELQRLNKIYRNVDSPTDVLAFAMREGEDADIHPQLLGDIVISVETAQKQASEVGHSLDMELALLTVHGVLHLLGYDDMTERESAIMRVKEETILRLL